MDESKNPFEEYVNGQPAYYSENELAFAKLIEKLQEEAKRRKRKRVLQIAMRAGWTTLVSIGIVAGVNYLEQKSR